MCQENHELNSVGNPNTYSNIGFLLCPDSNSNIPIPESDYYIISEGVEVITRLTPDEYRVRLENVLNFLKPDFKELIIITDRTAEDLSILEEMDPRVKVINLPFFAMYVFYAIPYRKQKTKTVPTKNSKFRYTPGKLAKPHRILVLEALHNMGYLDEQKGNWSLKMPMPGTPYYQAIEKLDLGIDINKFSNYNRNLDVDLNEHTDDNGYTHHNMGIPFGYKSYLDSGYCIIAESETQIQLDACNSNKNAWITEKTWLPIVNCMPFILIGQESIVKNLHSMGFYTYEDLYNQDLQWKWNTQPKLFSQQITDAIYNMETCINENFKEIERRSLHNRKHFLKMCQELHDIHFKDMAIQETAHCSVIEAFLTFWSRPVKVMPG